MNWIIGYSALRCLLITIAIHADVPLAVYCSWQFIAQTISLLVIRYSNLSYKKLGFDLGGWGDGRCQWSWITKSSGYMLHETGFGDIISWEAVLHLMGCLLFIPLCQQPAGTRIQVHWLWSFFSIILQ